MPQAGDATPRIKQLRWLRAELPGLVDRGVVDDSTASRVREHYGLDNLPEPRSPVLLVLGVLGTALLGAGLILILAHNWDELGRGVRAGISLGLLIAAQGLAGFALLRKPTSPAWLESTALALTLSVGASIALISQTYNIMGSTGDFVLVWLLLTIPAVYLFGSRVSAVLGLALTLFIPGGGGEMVAPALGWVLTAALILPYVVHTTQRAPHEAGATLLQWATCFTLPIGLAIVLADWSGFDFEHFGTIVFGSLFAAVYSHATTAERDAPQIGSPFATASLLGLAGVAILQALAHEWPWISFSVMNADLSPEVTMILMGAAGVAVWNAVSMRGWSMGGDLHRIVVGSFPAMMLLSILLLAPSGRAFMADVLINLYVVALGCALLWEGLRDVNLRRTNVGLLVLILFFVIRFFDPQYSLLVRGLGLMLFGLAFVLVNAWMVRRQRRHDGRSESGGERGEGEQGVVA